MKQIIFSCFWQMCQMDFEVTGKTDNWLRVEQEVDGVELLCKLLKLKVHFVFYSYIDIILSIAPRLLVEYEILKEVMQTKSYNNVSRAFIKVVFRRRLQYHITNTFLQVIYYITGVCS